MRAFVHKNQQRVLARCNKHNGDWPQPPEAAGDAEADGGRNEGVVEQHCAKKSANGGLPKSS